MVFYVMRKLWLVWSILPVGTFVKSLTIQNFTDLYTDAKCEGDSILLFSNRNQWLTLPCKSDESCVADDSGVQCRKKPSGGGIKTVTITLTEPALPTPSPAGSGSGSGSGSDSSFPKTVSLSPSTGSGQPQAQLQPSAQSSCSAQGSPAPEILIEYGGPAGGMQVPLGGTSPSMGSNSGVDQSGQSTGQPAEQSSPQSTSQTTSQGQTSPQTSSQTSPQSTSQTTPQAGAQSTSQSTSQAQAGSQTTSQSTSQSGGVLSSIPVSSIQPSPTPAISSSPSLPPVVTSKGTSLPPMPSTPSTPSSPSSDANKGSLGTENPAVKIPTGPGPVIPSGSSSTLSNTASQSTSSKSSSAPASGHGSSPSGGGTGSLTLSQLQQAVTACGYGANYKQDFAQELVNQINKNKWDSNETSMFLAQIFHESGGLAHLVEQACASSPCTQYNNADGANGAVKGAPGKNYFGRGYIQLSWPSNYQEASKSIYNSDKIFQNPDLVASDKTVAAETSIWYWNKKVMTSKAPLSQFGLSTKAINGPIECGKGPNSQAQQRWSNYQKIAKILGVTKLAAESGCYN
ncbi:hypothetical protein NECID01_0506 [Nematocida sp. AWRm77]|nr:hypothetical protein NECID01_0506 [Nematocida sp. AWRm77]